MERLEGYQELTRKPGCVKKNPDVVFFRKVKVNEVIVKCHLQHLRCLRRSTSSPPNFGSAAISATIPTRIFSGGGVMSLENVGNPRLDHGCYSGVGPWTRPQWLEGVAYRYRGGLFPPTSGALRRFDAAGGLAREPMAAHPRAPQGVQAPEEPLKPLQSAPVSHRRGPPTPKSHAHSSSGSAPSLSCCRRWVCSNFDAPTIFETSHPFQVPKVPTQAAAPPLIGPKARVPFYR